MSFFQFLEKRVAKTNSLVCVGIDPHGDDIKAARTKYGLADSEGDDAEVVKRFCCELVDETKEVAAAYKPNAAFFEALGAPGIKALEELIAYIPDDIPVVLDVKRGDISSTATAYAIASYEKCKAHCVTLHPYMGLDSVDPFVGSDPAHGAFVLCKTSNPSSEDFETLELRNGSLLYEEIARKCSEWNKNDNIGLVVGATDIEAVSRSRKAAPKLWILAPGVGFQGGNLEETARVGLREDGLGLLVPISRGIARAESPKAAAEGFRDEINRVRDQLKNEGSNSVGELAPYQAAFFELAVSCGVLKFGKFTLKSGRESPYFFNAGLFSTGSALEGLGNFYAEAIHRSNLEFDVIFGPAYKGIPLASVIACSMYRKYNKDYPFAYNRKEAKDHGEGGVLVGASVKNKRVLVVDDVITAGTAIRESIDMLAKENATVGGVVIALDRQEKANENTDKSAIQAVNEEFGFDVVSIVGLDDLLSFLNKSSSQFEASVLEDVKQYRIRYGVDKK